MADVVQFRLERMSDELDDLEKRGLFSRDEIAGIVKRRREFEYRLKRPCPLKQDFLLYIEFEKDLDALRNLRKRKIIGEMEQDEKEKNKKKKGKKWKKSISDVAGILRILDVYRMAVMRYKGDLEIWFQYLEFCREKKHGRMKKVLAQVLKFHPKVPGLWIYAAAWEFDQNLNVASARNLMWSGLRACPNSEDLWIEYLRMELTYLNKLKARKIALGEDIGTVEKKNEDGEQWKKENEDLFMSLNEEKGHDGSNLEEDTLEKKDDPFSQQGSEILQTIYHGAVKALPLNMNLRKRFLEVLDTVSLKDSENLRKKVMEDFKKDFAHDELYWDWIARLQIKDASKSAHEFTSRLNKAVEVFEEALNILPSTKMFSVYVKFWLDIIDLHREGSDTLVNNIGADVAMFASSILKVFERAESSGFLTENLASQYISFFLQIGKIEEAKSLAEKLCSGRLSDDANLWLLRMSIELKWRASKTRIMSKDELRSFFKLLTDVLTKLSISKAEALWIMAIKYFSSDKDCFEKLVKSLIISLAGGGGGDGDSGCLISSAIVNRVLQRDGIQHAREMYKRLLALPRPSLAFFKRCIELESNLAAVGEHDAIVNARKLYESALYIYGQNRELWKEYYTMEMKVGTSATANAVYWRARKALKDNSGLSDISDM